MEHYNHYLSPAKTNQVVKHFLNQLTQAIENLDIQKIIDWYDLNMIATEKVPMDKWPQKFLDLILEARVIIRLYRPNHKLIRDHLAFEVPHTFELFTKTHSVCIQAKTIDEAIQIATVTAGLEVISFTLAEPPYQKGIIQEHHPEPPTEDLPF